MILMIGKVLDLVIDDVPEEIDLKMRREAYLARQAVAAAKQEVKTMLYLQKNDYFWRKQLVNFFT